VYVCMCTYIYVLNIPIFCAIWLRKCDFLTEKLGIKFIPDPDWPDPDPKLFIPDPTPDPAKSSGSGSTTLFLSQQGKVMKVNSSSSKNGHMTPDKFFFSKNQYGY
jgi:hypothetical protein